MIRKTVVLNNFLNEHLANGDSIAAVSEPLVIIYEDSNKHEDGNHRVVCRIHPRAYTYAHYGLLVSGLVRCIAKHFAVPENDIWEWVDKERDQPTADIKSRTARQRQ